MKLNCKFIVNAVVAGFAMSTANAATQPARMVMFTPSKPSSILNVKSSSWRDFAFGDMGWSHSSDWGKFMVEKGKTVKIKLVTKVPGLHPGVTVWYRGKDDTAPDTYVADHFYPQNANIFEAGAKNETTGKELGNIAMRHIAHGYDNDGHKDYLDEDGLKTLTPPAGMNGLKDKVAGQVVLAFKAPKKGNYQFVVGGFNPGKGVDGKIKHPVTATISVTP